MNAANSRARPAAVGLVMSLVAGCMFDAAALRALPDGSTAAELDAASDRPSALPDGTPGDYPALDATAADRTDVAVDAPAGSGGGDGGTAGTGGTSGTGGTAGTGGMAGTGGSAGTGGMGGTGGGPDAGASTCAAVPGAIGWWTGDITGGKALDVSGHGHDGTVEAPAASTPGLVGQAFHFTGFPSGVAIPDAPELTPSTGLTMELWLRWPASSGPTPVRFFGKQQDNSFDSSYYVAPSTSGAIQADLFSDGGRGLIERGAAIPTNKWTHLAVTWDGQQVRTYLDGEPQEMVPFAGPIHKISAPVRIGRGDTIPYYAVIGDLDEVTLYARGLSAAEIHAIYQAGAAGKCKP